MKEVFLLFIASLVASVPAVGLADNDPYIQYLPEYMPQSPNAQAVARAIDIPVNYYTGIPNISIPLYTIQLGSLTVPVTLSYQGGGIRPSQEATSVGLGWVLNAGGSITRTIKCADDFMEYYVSGSQFSVGFWGRSGWPDFSIPFDNNFYRRVSYSSGEAEAGFYYYLYVDSEPDLFYYSLPSKSGKFSFKKDQSIVYFDKSANVRINPSFGVNPHFTAIDANGTAYCFESKERTQVYSGSSQADVNTTRTGVDITSLGPNDYLTEVSDYTSTWFLDRMISSTNDTIDFEYTDETFMLPLQESCRYMKRVQGASLHQEGDGVRYSRTKTTVDSKRLTRIAWRGGYVQFIYGQARTDLVGEAKALTDVKVYNATNQLVCHWHMSYGYFDTDMTDVPANRKHLFKRLRLNSVMNMLTEQDPYQFSYYEDVVMPLKNTKNLDYWGYYNGVNQGNNYYCPAHNGIIPSYKSANEYYSKMGVLEEIAHPTGGLTKLHWECNKTGESIFVDEPAYTSHDSYTRGYLITHKGGTIDEEEKCKAVLLSDTTEIYLLLSTAYINGQSSPGNVGTAFTIEKINSTGSNTQCYAWNTGTVGDETEKTIVLGPGSYAFKCKAVTDNIEYKMFFIDSKNKNKISKENSDMIYCYRGTGVQGVPETDSTIVTLAHSSVLFLNCFCDYVTTTENINIPNQPPFRLSKRTSSGTYNTLYSWLSPSIGQDETRILYLDAGTYKIECNAIIDDLCFGISFSYGDVQYTPTNCNSFDNSWKKSVIMAYHGVNVPNPDFSTIESDTIVLDSPTRMYLNFSYSDEDSVFNAQTFTNSRPVRIYKQSDLGIYELVYSIVGSCLSVLDSPSEDLSGLYLEPGTYVVTCEATVNDVVVMTDVIYKSDGVYSNNGANRGGLRIGRVEGEKDITYLYEDGKDIIKPCTFYREEHLYDDNGIYKMVYYDVQPSESVRPLSTLKNGNTIGYSKVLEVFADNSRREYVYHNEEEELVDPDYPYSPSYTDWLNGQLLKQVCYNALGDTVSLTANAYNTFVTQENYMVGFSEVRPSYNIYYFNRVQCPLLSATMNTEYRGNGKLTTRQSFLYNEDLQCKEETKRVGSDTLKTIYKYPRDFSDEVSQLMDTTNKIGTPVATLYKRNGVFFGGTRIVYGNFNELTDSNHTAT